MQRTWKLDSVVDRNVPPVPRIPPFPVRKPIQSVDRRLERPLALLRRQHRQESKPVERPALERSITPRAHVGAPVRNQRPDLVARAGESLRVDAAAAVVVGDVFQGIAVATTTPVVVGDRRREIQSLERRTLPERSLLDVVDPAAKQRKRVPIAHLPTLPPHRSEAGGHTLHQDLDWAAGRNGVVISERVSGGISRERPRAVRSLAADDERQILARSHPGQILLIKPLRNQFLQPPVRHPSSTRDLRGHRKRQRLDSGAVRHVGQLGMRSKNVPFRGIEVGEGRGRGRGHGGKIREGGREKIWKEEIERRFREDSRKISRRSSEIRIEIRKSEVVVGDRNRNRLM
ncbi:hypothetical protein HDK77DRAFT_153883 [Phyllosticta capitalensis]|uniref:Uncharacterized protein n=1 Tax=Phyllosticta capitalensis TaxID=121624 RepID=A0ABR1YTJ5_9PEZI